MLQINYPLRTGNATASTAGKIITTEANHQIQHKTTVKNGLINQHYKSSVVAYHAQSMEWWNAAKTAGVSGQTCIRGVDRGGEHSQPVENGTN